MWIINDDHEPLQPELWSVFSSPSYISEIHQIHSFSGSGPGFSVLVSVQRVHFRNIESSGSWNCGLILTVSEWPLFPWLQGKEKGLPYLEVQHPENHLISASPLFSAWLPDISVEGAEEGGVGESSVSAPHTEPAGWIRKALFYIFSMILVGTEVCSEALWNFWLYILRPIAQGHLHFSDFGGEELRNFPELNGQERGPRTQGPSTECQNSKRPPRPES